MSVVGGNSQAGWMLFRQNRTPHMLVPAVVSLPETLGSVHGHKSLQAEPPEQQENSLQSCRKCSQAKGAARLCVIITHSMRPIACRTCPHVTHHHSAEQPSASNLWEMESLNIQGPCECCRAT